MPFTFSHAALVLPLLKIQKQWFSLTALVIGSFTPDFEYYLKMELESHYSHSAGAVFWFNLPLGIALAFIFHRLVRDPLIDNLPKAIKARLIVFKSFDWNSYFRKKWPVVIASVVIGAASHLFWDSFTHETGFFVQKIEWLTNKFQFFGQEVPAYRLAQHLSTAVGGVIILLVLFRLPAQNNIKTEVNYSYWLTLILIVFAVLGIRLMTGLELQPDVNLIVNIISAIMISLILTPQIVFSKK